MSIDATLGIPYLMQDEKFEWHDAKARLNPINHNGITFTQAVDVFSDFNAYDYLDDKADEERWNIVGLSNGKLLHVTYTWRGPRRRIISAREAQTHEANAYYTGSIQF